MTPDEHIILSVIAATKKPWTKFIGGASIDALQRANPGMNVGRAIIGLHEVKFIQKYVRDGLDDCLWYPTQAGLLALKKAEKEGA